MPEFTTFQRFILAKMDKVEAGLNQLLESEARKDECLKSIEAQTIRTNGTLLAHAARLKPLEEDLTARIAIRGARRFSVSSTIKWIMASIAFVTLVLLILSRV